MSGSAQIMTTAIRTPENTEQASIERKILWLKISFWIGAILDAMFYIDVFVGSMFDSKSIFSWIFTLEDANFTDEYRFSLGLVGSLMRSAKRHSSTHNYCIHRINNQQCTCLQLRSLCICKIIT
jgi:hypothetical protein